MKNVHLLSRLLACLAILCLSLPAQAQSRPDQIVRAAFLPGWQLPDGRHIAGLRLELQPGWKTYWRVPGEAGIAPQFRLEGEGLEGVQVMWPEPQLFSQAGLLGIGYAERVVVPLVLLGAPRAVEGRVDIGVCNEVCVPVGLGIEGRIDSEARPDPELLAAMAAQPLSASEAGITPPQCEIRPVAQGFAVTLQLDLAGRAPPDHVVVEPGDPRLAATPRPRMQVAGDVLTVMSELERRASGAAALSRDDLRVTLLGNGRAVELRGCS